MLKLESVPEIRGSTPSLTFDESPYFNRVNTLLRKYFIDNLYNNQNLKNSLELKSFISNPRQPTNFDDITWLEYITNYLEITLEKCNYPWCNDLLDFIKDQSFASESKYNSIFFYNDFLLKTMPQSLTNQKDIDNDENIIDIDKFENSYKKNQKKKKK